MSETYFLASTFQKAASHIPVFIFQIFSECFFI